MTQISVSKRALPCAIQKLHQAANVDYSDMPLDLFSLPQTALSREEALEVADKLLAGEGVSLVKSKPLELHAQVSGNRVAIDLERYEQIHGKAALASAITTIQQC